MSASAPPTPRVSRPHGPQYYLKRGIKGPLGKILATAFAIFAVFASFGIGNLTQANSVATNMESAFGVTPVASGALMFVLVGAVLLGGIQAIGRITSAFVPLMIIIYVVGGLVVLIVNMRPDSRSTGPHLH